MYRTQGFRNQVLWGFEVTFSENFGITLSEDFEITCPGYGHYRELLSKSRNPFCPYRDSWWRTKTIAHFFLTAVFIPIRFSFTKIFVSEHKYGNKRRRAANWIGQAGEVVLMEEHNVHRRASTLARVRELWWTNKMAPKKLEITATIFKKKSCNSLSSILEQCGQGWRMKDRYESMISTPLRKEQYIKCERNVTVIPQK